MTTSTVRHPGEYRWETRLLAVVTMALVCFGIAACFAAGSYVPNWYRAAEPQLSGAAIGGALFLGFAYLDYAHLRRFAAPLYWATVAGLGVIAVVNLLFPGRPGPGVVQELVPYINGSRRWITLGVQVQVSEVARLTMPIFVAAVAAGLGPKIRSLRQGFVPVMWPVALVAALTVIQPNRSMAILLLAGGVAVAFVAGVRLVHLLLVALTAIPVLLVSILTSSEMNERIAAYANPSIDCPSTEQYCESLIGFGHGGVFGVGFGKGTQKLGHLAYGYSDYILSVIGEEWGLMGVLFLLLCFVLFCWMGFRIARTARDPFGMALAGGLTAAIGVSAFLHAGVVTDLLPATGQTLPFVSAGRLALIVTMSATGVIVSVGRRRGRLVRPR